MISQSSVHGKSAEILRLASEQGARNVRIIGSVARGQESKGSDLDLLVEFEEERSLLDQVRLIQDLEMLLDCSVHVVEAEGVHWLIRDKILEEAMPL